MTLVSYKHRFIFLKTFKTASTSVEGYLERYCLPVGAETGQKKRPAQVSEFGIAAARGSSNSKAAGIWRGHMPAVVVRDAVGPNIWQSYAKIVTTRNIYARLVSYFGASNRDSMTRDVPRDEKIQRFRAWLLEADASLRNLNICTIDGVPVVDRAVRFENLSEDMAALCQDLGLPDFDVEQLPHWRNHVKRRHRLGDPRDFYDAECREFVKVHYDWEIDRFGYTLENATLAA